MLRIYKWPQFQTLHANSTWWEVKMHVSFSLFYIYLEKWAKFSLLLAYQQTAVLRTPVTNSHLTCFYKFKKVVCVADMVCPCPREEDNCIGFMDGHGS